MPAACMRRVKRCRKHRIGRYSARFDTYYCVKCDRWLEGRCENAKLCMLCSTRPRRPSMVE